MTSWRSHNDRQRHPSSHECHSKHNSHCNHMIASKHPPSSVEGTPPPPPRAEPKYPTTVPCQLVSLLQIMDYATQRLQVTCPQCGTASSDSRHLQERGREKTSTPTLLSIKEDPTAFLFIRNNLKVGSPSSTHPHKFTE